MVIEFIAHTRMAKFRTVGWAHWLVMVGFLLGAIVWFEAYGQTFNPEFHWPIFGNWAIYHLVDEILGLGTVIGITTLIVIRQLNHPRLPVRLSRFGGSDFKAAYFVETVVLIEGLGMIFVKAGKIATYGHANPWTDFFTMNLAKLLPASAMMVAIFAFIKLMSGMIWLYIVGRNITWGVAWHRFSAFFNIYFKREDDGGVALGAAKPMMSKGKALTMDNVDPDTDTLGAGQIEDFSWKGWLDFTTCTECGRCQSQCPAWNTGKPLSPSSSSCRCVTTATPRPRTCSPVAARTWAATKSVSSTPTATSTTPPSPQSRRSHALKPTANSSAKPSRVSWLRSSTSKPCGAAPTAAPASSSAPSTSNTSTTSSTCAATRS